MAWQDNSWAQEALACPEEDLGAGVGAEGWAPILDQVVGSGNQESAQEAGGRDR